MTHEPNAPAAVEQSEEDRQLLVEEMRPDHPQWGEIRRRILDGTVDIHSDGVSAICSMALRAIAKARALSPSPDTLGEVITAWLSERYGWAVDEGDPNQVRAYYGGNWIEIDFAPLAKTLATTRLAASKEGGWGDAIYLCLSLPIDVRRGKD